MPLAINKLDVVTFAVSWISQNGTIMPRLALIYSLRDHPDMSAFKSMQECLELSRVFVVLNKISAGFKGRLGNEVEIDLQHVSELLANKSGKYRYEGGNITPLN